MKFFNQMLLILAFFASSMLQVTFAQQYAMKFNPDFEKLRDFVDQLKSADRAEKIEILKELTGKDFQGDLIVLQTQVGPAIEEIVATKAINGNGKVQNVHNILNDLKKRFKMNKELHDTLAQLHLQIKEALAQRAEELRALRSLKKGEQVGEFQETAQGVRAKKLSIKPPRRNPKPMNPRPIVATEEQYYSEFQQ